MPVRIVISAAAGLLLLIGFVPYIRAILRGETKPAKATWLIWGILDTVTFAGMLAEGALNGQILGAVIGVWIIVFLAFGRGASGWTNLDKLCLFGAVVGVVLWKTFNDPVLGIVTAQVVMFIGAIPTFVSSWKKPEDEDRTAWTIFWVSCVLAMIAIPAWTFEDATQPITFFAIESIMMYILYVHARRIKSSMTKE